MITLNPARAGKQWCVYLIRRELDSPFHVGYCMLRDVIKMPDMWMDKPDAMCVLHLLGTFETKPEALSLYVKKCIELGFKYHMHLARRGCIKNDTNGTVYKTAQDCCKAENINPGALSRHLRRLAGHKTIRGMTYTRIP